MKTHSTTFFSVDEAMSCPLYADLRLSICYAMSWLELEGWIAQACRAHRVGALTLIELDGLLDEAQNVGEQLPEI